MNVEPVIGYKLLSYAGFFKPGFFFWGLMMFDGERLGYLINPDLVPDKRVIFICLPLKIVNSEGAPARAVALESE